MNDKKSMDELLASVNTMIDQVDKESDAVLRVLNHDPMAQKAAHSELIRNAALIATILALFLVGSDMDFKDQCSRDAVCASKYLEK